MPRRLQFGSVTSDTLQSLDAQIGTGNENGNNPDNDLVIRDSTGSIVLRYDESAEAWEPEVFAFQDTTADPSANGELQRNGADLKAYSGGAVRNLSNIGSGGGTTSPGGADTQVQYNDGGSFGGDSALTWDATNDVLTAANLNVSTALTAALNYDGNDADNVGTVDFQNTTEPQVTSSNSTSYTADLAMSNYHKVTMTGDVTFDFSNVDATDVNTVVLHLVQDATGGRTPSFTPTVVWDSGSAPSWSTAANAEDIVTFIHDQDGSQWIGLLGGLGLA